MSPMVNTLDVYNLASAVLNGKENAHKVLADVLEESGERGLAQWARKGKGSGRKRLDFALAIVPYTTAVLLVCDYVEHLISNQDWLAGREIIKLVRSALQQEQIGTPWLSEVQRIADRKRWWQSDVASKNVRVPGHDFLTHFIEAGQQALLAAWHHQQGHATESLTFAEKAQAAARRTAKATLCMNSDELRWQIEHTKKALEKLWLK